MQSWGDADGAGARPAGQGPGPAEIELPEWRSAGDRSPSRFARTPDGGTPPPPAAFRPEEPAHPEHEREHRRRRFFATLGAALAILVVTSPAVGYADDAVGDALGLRHAMPPARPQDLGGQNVTDLSFGTTPGDQFYVTVPDRWRYSVSCQIRDGDEWTALPRLSTRLGWTDWLTSSRSRRGGFLGRMSTTRIHEFFVVERLTTLRCGSPRAGARIEVWHDDGGRHTAYRGLTWGIRGAWLAAGTAVLWVPMLVRLRLRRAAGE